MLSGLGLGVVHVSAAPTTHVVGGSRLIAAEVRHTVWRTEGSSAPVHVVSAGAQAQVSLRVVQAPGGLAGGRETTSALCRETRGCLAAVNGDFFTGNGPVGGVIVGNRMLRSPIAGHEQLSVQPLRATRKGLGPDGWSAVVLGAGLAPLRIDGINVTGLADAVVLYTPDYAGATPDCVCTEVLLTGPAAAATSLTASTQFLPVARASGGSALSEQRVVLAGAGTGADRLQELWALQQAVTVEVRVAQASASNVGSHPILLQDGRPTPYDENDPMLSQAQPRTAVAWDDAGRVWLVAADGRQERGPGLTAAKTVGFLRQLGARHGVLLDGGGSTTLALGGRVANRPSDGHERAVSNAVLLIADPKPAAVRRAPLPLSTQVAAAARPAIVVSKPATPARAKTVRVTPRTKPKKVAPAKTTATVAAPRPSVVPQLAPKLAALKVVPLTPADPRENRRTAVQISAGLLMVFAGCAWSVTRVPPSRAARQE